MARCVVQAIQLRKASGNDLAATRCVLNVVWPDVQSGESRDRGMVNTRATLCAPFSFLRVRHCDQQGISLPPHRVSRLKPCPHQMRWRQDSVWPDAALLRTAVVIYQTPIIRRSVQHCVSPRNPAAVVSGIRSSHHCAGCGHLPHRYLPVKPAKRMQPCSGTCQGDASAESSPRRHGRLRTLPATVSRDGPTRGFTPLVCSRETQRPPAANR
jgi:hypothetical protein